MKYCVKYRKPGCFFWTKIKNVVSDYCVEGVLMGDEKGTRLIKTEPKWVFVMEDDSKIEIPANYEIFYSKERFQIILKNKEKEVGQKIPTK